MEKKVTTISIDGLLFKKAKREIPNLSEFVEKCLKVYFNVSDNDDNVDSIQYELNKIKEARLKIHLLSENNLNEVSLNGFDNHQINNIWMKIWGTYRSNNTYHGNDLKEASIILGKSENDLIDIMQDLVYNLHKNELSKCNDWETALKIYKEL